MKIGVYLLKVVDNVEETNVADILINTMVPEVVTIKYYSNIVALLPFNPKIKPTFEQLVEFLNSHMISVDEKRCTQVIHKVEIFSFDRQFQV